MHSDHTYNLKHKHKILKPSICILKHSHSFSWLSRKQKVQLGIINIHYFMLLFANFNAFSPLASIDNKIIHLTIFTRLNEWLLHLFEIEVEFLKRRKRKKEGEEEEEEKEGKRRFFQRLFNVLASSHIIQIFSTQLEINTIKVSTQSEGHSCCWICSK